jgi:hypothetical protein
MLGKKMKKQNNSIDFTALSKRNFTLIEILLVMVIMFILAGLLAPGLIQAKQRAKFERWFAYNKQWNRDADCVINFNFQEGEGDVLYNGCHGCDFPGYNSKTYNGHLSSTGAGDHNLEWIAGGRWGQFKKALQFNGSDTYVNVPQTSAIDFTPADSFTLLAWVKFDKFELGDGIYSKSGWGTKDDASAQYDLYCDPTAGATGDGAFEVDVFTTCVGWDQTDVEIDKIGWCQVVLRYEGTTDGSDGQISCFVNGKPLGEARETNNAVATQTHSDANCILGAIGAKEEYWGKPIIFPFQGRMDEFLMFKRALSDKEIEGHYEMGRE